MLGLSLRVSWICLLLFSSAACFPATKGDYRYPYTISSSDSSGPAAGSNLQPDSSRSSLASLQHEAAPAQASSGSQFPSSVGAPIVAAGSSPRYDPPSAPANMGSDVSAYGPSHEALVFTSSAHAGHTAPTFPMDGPVPYAGPAAYAGPPLQPQPVGGSGTSDLGSGVLAYSPAHGASHSSGSAGHTAPTFPMDGPVSYAAPVAPSHGSPGLRWDAQPAGGADSSFSLPSNWMPSHSFPDFSAWDSNSEMPQGGMMHGPSETSPLPPSSYIIQSSNGYQRAREYLSHTRYSPEYPEPPMPFRAAEAPRKSPMTGSKGGQKV